MMRSLFSGVSGLRNHQTRMDVIGNNIANVNTVGFKASRVNFQDVLSQTLQGASSASGNRGGTNPMQVGLGMGLASIDTVFTDGSFQPTGKATDLSIKGQGFFILSDNSGNEVFTRAGNFDFDTDGNFGVPGTGYKVRGWMGANGIINTSGNPTDIVIPVGSGMQAKDTTGVTISNNLSAEAATGDTKTVSINVYDSQGAPHKLTGTFTKLAAANTWSFTPTGITDASFSPAPTPSTIVFDGSGNYSTTSTINTLTIDPTNGANNFTITPDFSGLTQYGGTSTAEALGQNGYTSGTLESTTIDPSGIIVGKFSNGQSQNLAQVALATFNNPGGLNKLGDNLFVRSNNSGEPQRGPAGTGGRGTFTPGTLEMANVDLAQEFSNMIITQRGFQANSKIITTTDEMLQELANLKR